MGSLDETSHPQELKTSELSEIPPFLSTICNCIKLHPHHSPFSSLQEASSSFPGCSLLLLPDCLWSLKGSCSGFHTSILCQPHPTYTVLFLLCTPTAFGREEGSAVGIILKFPRGSTAAQKSLWPDIFVNMLLANTRAARENSCLWSHCDQLGNTMICFC